MSRIEYACRWEIAQAYATWQMQHRRRPLGLFAYRQALGLDVTWEGRR